jgi:ABC-type multidrug transport system fused ATPase/permease subunit
MKNFKIFFSKSYSLLNRTQKNQLRTIIFLLVLGMIIESFSLAIIFPLIKVITEPDIVFSNPTFKNITQELNIINTQQILIITIFLIIFIYLLKTIFMLFSSWKQSKFAYSFQYSISNKLYRKYLLRDYKLHTEQNSSKLISTVIMETNAFTQAFLLPLLYVISELFILIGIVILIFYVNPFGALIITTILFFTSLIFSKITKKQILFWGTERQKFEAKRIQNIQEGLGGIKEIKVLGCESSFINKYEKSNFSSANLGMKISFMQNIPKQIIELVSILSISLIIFFNTVILEGGGDLLPVLALFVASAFRMMPSVNRIMSSLQNIRFSIPVVELLYDELKDFSNLQNSVITNSKIEFNNEFKISNLNFEYDNGNLIFDEINLTVQKGETIGIVGGSGIGKSTLIDIILGILNPQKGDITIDNISIYDNLRLWQNNIGYVPQSIYLVDDTIKHNVALGVDSDKINLVNLDLAIREAQLDEFIKNSEYGYDTIVGENGIKLSGGQKQRIGIARALYHRPQVLIFDEATSALDTNTELEVMKSINNLKGKKTIFIIAHRLSTLENCDKIYQIVDKKLILKVN